MDFLSNCSIDGIVMKSNAARLPLINFCMNGKAMIISEPLQMVIFWLRLVLMMKMVEVTTLTIYSNAMLQSTTTTHPSPFANEMVMIWMLLVKMMVMKVTRFNNLLM